MTAYRSQTDAMLAAKFDPAPWRSPLPVPETSEYVRADYVVPGWVLDPRPEFIPSRHTRLRADGRIECADTFEGGNVGCLVSGWCILRDGHSGDCEEDRGIWPGADEPFERPAPNPILVALRTSLHNHLAGVEEWLDAYDRFDTYGGTIDWDFPGHEFHALTIATPDQIDHARKVLVRLANLTKGA